jgi:hypothetical protein
MPFASLIELIENTAIPIGLVLAILALLATRSGRKVLQDAYHRGQRWREKEPGQRPDEEDPTTHPHA